jgi:hypothetical protein
MSTSILSFSTQKLRHVIPMTLAALQEDGRRLNDFPLSLLSNPKTEIFNGHSCVWFFQNGVPTNICLARP